MLSMVAHRIGNRTNLSPSATNTLTERAIFWVGELVATAPCPFIDNEVA